MATRTSTDKRQAPRPAPLQTSLQKPQAPQISTPIQTQFQPANGTPKTPTTDSPQTKPGHQRFVLTDPVAFRYLEEDPATTVLERRRELQGYECYIVEQWTTSRSHPTFTITTYTGDPSHTVVVGVLSVPTDEASWSPRLRVYFKALNQYHAKRRETPLGLLIVTNLSGFPSSLTVIPVPDGDLRTHRSDFFVAENLKRLNCSGRLGLTLTSPAASTVAKFHQLYRTSDKNSIYHSVIELVKLCQSALTLFDKLQVDYADGLLCDVTERAVNDWWVEMGSEYYHHIEPHDGILGPTTVAGLLGLLMGARNRLHAENAPVGKVAFDVEGMKKGISAFQKRERLPRSRRLDRRTLERLHRSSAKAARHEGGWAVPKAVKNTVAELSGKGGEMVMDVVGRRDRAGIAEVETCDIDRFVQLVYGERAKWLWYGKALKHKAVAKEVMGNGPADDVQRSEQLPGNKDLTFQERPEPGGGFTWTARKSLADGLSAGVTGRRPKDEYDNVSALTDPSDNEEGEVTTSKGVFKRTTGFKQEAKSRFKGVVGLGSSGRQNDNSREDSSPQTPRSPQSPRASIETPEQQRSRRPPMGRAQTSPVSDRSSPGSPPGPAMEQQRFTAGSGTYGESILEQDTAPRYAESYKEAPRRKESSPPPPPSYRTSDVQQDITKEQISDADWASETVTAEPSVEGSVEDLNRVRTAADEDTDNEQDQDGGRLLRRTRSQSHLDSNKVRSNDAYPRHLSFSLAEESVLRWPDIADARDPYFNDAKAQMADEKFFAEEARDLRTLISDLESSTAPFTRSQLSALSGLLEKLDADGVRVQELSAPYDNRVHELQTHSEQVLRGEKEGLEEAGKEIETLAAKLEYEVGGLKGRIEEVGNGVGDFERGVRRVEDRVGELEKEGKRSEEREWGCVVS